MKPTHVDALDCTDALPTGTVIDGRYTITGVLACGGMGIVHRARHEPIGIEVAVKTIRTMLMIVPEVRERFADEARVMGRLRSVHVPRVLDYGTLPDRRPYLAMELLEGEDAADRLARTGPMSNEVVRDALLQVCDALAEAHALGIVHRDLKPANLFFATDGCGNEIVKVLDFGIARSRARGAKALTLVGAGLGSPHYMAPEQIEGSAEIDARADIWTLGVVAYELLTGEPPFEGAGVSEICARVMSQQRKPILDVRPDVWSSMVAFIDRCLRVRPEERFQDVHSARAALARTTAAAASSRDSEHPHVIDTSPITTIPGLAPRRWPKVLAALAVGALAWAAWSHPDRARALGDRAVQAVYPPAMLDQAPTAHAERKLEAPATTPVRHTVATREKDILVPDAGTDSGDGDQDASRASAFADASSTGK